MSGRAFKKIKSLKMYKKQTSKVLSSANAEALCIAHQQCSTASIMQTNVSSAHLLTSTVFCTATGLHGPVKNFHKLMHTLVPSLSCAVISTFTDHGVNSTFAACSTLAERFALKTIRQ